MRYVCPCCRSWLTKEPSALFTEWANPSPLVQVMALPTLTVTVSGEKAKSWISTAVAGPCGGLADAEVVALVLLESDATPRPSANAAAPMVTTAATITAMRGRPATPDLRTAPGFGSSRSRRFKAHDPRATAPA